MAAKGRQQGTWYLPLVCSLGRSSSPASSSVSGSRNIMAEREVLPNGDGGMRACPAGGSAQRRVASLLIGESSTRVGLSMAKSLWEGVPLGMALAPKRDARGTGWEGHGSGGAGRRTRIHAGVGAQPWACLPVPRRASAPRASDAEALREEGFGRQWNAAPTGLAEGGARGP
jgi:hypothetical protein